KFFEATENYTIQGYDIPEDIDISNYNNPFVQSPLLSIQQTEDATSYKFVSISGVLKKVGEEEGIGWIRLSIDNLPIISSPCQ
ncbi:MAG: hypothetical protein AAF738_04065, partial [Bacteroidota bacterium]